MVKAVYCRICREKFGTGLTVTATRSHRSREWALIVCRDCWRVFEAMLDEGTLGYYQADLETPAALGRLPWFL